MSQMKKMVALFESYDNLPDSRFKEEIREGMNKIKELLHYDDYSHDPNQCELADNNPDDGSWKGR